MPLRTPAKPVPDAILKPRGLCCPMCGSNKLRVTSIYQPRNGLRIRYRKCEKGHRVKTREVVVNVRE